MPKLLARPLFPNASLAHHLGNGLSVFNSLHVHRSIHHRKSPRPKREQEKLFLEVPDQDERWSAFSYLRIVDTSPGEQEELARSLLERLGHLRDRAERQEISRQRDTFGKDKNLRDFSLRPRKFCQDLAFTSATRPFMGHRDVTLSVMRETVAHRVIRSRNTRRPEAKMNGCEETGNEPPILNGGGEEGRGGERLLPEIRHDDSREPLVRRCVAVEAPGFLSGDLHPPVAGAAREEYSSDRGHAHRAAALAASPGGRARETLNCGRPGAHEAWRLGLRLSFGGAPEPGGLWGCRPGHGFSNVAVPDKQALVSDSGKLHALDGLLARLKSGGHRVLVYSQMTRMIDLLEEFMRHRKHSYIRLDGSSKISDRRDLVADFQQRSDIFVFLLSTRAGGLGINLTAADTVG